MSEQDNNSRINEVIARAFQEAMNREHEYVTLEHILRVMLEDEEIRDILIDLGVDVPAMVEEIDEWLREQTEIRVEGVTKPRKTATIERCFNRAYTQAIFTGRGHMEPLDLLISIASEKNSHANYFLAKNGVTKEALIGYVSRIKDSHSTESKNAKKRDSEKILNKYTTNLIRSAEKKLIDPLIGREKEVFRLAQTLTRKKKNNVIMVGEPGVGKAQPLDAKIKTPNGWIKMGDIQIGDIVSTPDGNTAPVIGLFPQGTKDIYRVTFKDGRSTECCDEHLWNIWGAFGETYHTQSDYRRKKLDIKTVDLNWIRKKMESNKNFTPRIPLINPAKIDDVELPIDPWLMGFLLGDGSFADTKIGSFSTGDREILDLIESRLEKGYEINHVQNYDYRIRSENKLVWGKGLSSERKGKFLDFYKDKISNLGLSGTLSHTKFIPEIYKTSSIQQREDIISGLVDSDGHVSKNGSLSITTVSERLAKDIQEIIWSLGGIANIRHSTDKTYVYNNVRKPCKDAYTVSIRYYQPNRLSKLSRKKNHLPGENYQYRNLKLAIEKIEYVGKKAAQCIMIDHPDHLYVTDDYIVTHNTAIVEGLAVAISRNEVPAVLKGKTVYSLDIGRLLAGTRYRGDFEERMQNVLEALEERDDAILFIDEIHMIMGAGSSGQGSMDVANLIKPSLEKGKLRCIGSTTYEEFRENFEKDRALLRRFTKLDIVEPTVEETRAMMRQVMPIYSRYHSVTCGEELIDMAIDYSVKHMLDKRLPDKAIDVLDAAMARVKVLNNGITEDMLELTKDHVRQEIADLTRIPIEQLGEHKDVAVTELESRMRTNVFGQDEAIERLMNMVYIAKSGLKEVNRPMANFLFVGPTGTGKTELAVQLSEGLGMELIRFDMSEYREPHKIASLIGSPPGYVGYSEGRTGSGKLINELERVPNCVLLFDEVEKAHPDVLQVLLGLMDNGIVTGSDNKQASARNAFIIMTSNLGAADAEKKTIGFGQQLNDSAVDDAVKRFFAPEFRNRLDAVVRFNRLDREIVRRIADKFMRQLQEQMQEQNQSIIYTQALLDYIAKDGFSETMGARPMKRLINEQVRLPLAKRIIREGATAHTVDYDGNQVIIR